MAWVNVNGQTYYDALEDALYPDTTLVSISAVFNQGSNLIFASDELDMLKQYLTVTATYTDSSTAVILPNSYTLSGTLVVGTSVITANYGGKSDSFNVMVSEYQVPDTTAVIATEGVCWSKTAPNTVNKAGFGVTQWYGYEFTQEALEACQYWDSENEYMTSNGWAGIKICTPDYLTYAAGYSWPASANYKHALGKDEVYTNHFTFTRNAVYNMQFSRQSVSQVAANGMSASIPLSDIDYCYAYWYKPYAASILPTGVSNGDIIFAGEHTPYYGLNNISEAPTLSAISTAFVQGSTVVTTSTTLTALKPMLSVTANYDDNSHLPVNLGLVALSGTLEEGTSTITATYNGKTATFDVVVSAAE